MDAKLIERSGNQCELCKSQTDLSSFSLTEDLQLYTCSVCKGQLGDTSTITPNHWHCLNESMWSEHSAVKIASYRMLRNLTSESWALDLLEQVYLDDEERKIGDSFFQKDDEVVVKDSNGTILQAGDTVTLIKDLNVKGAGFTAKRGTVVRNISLTDNPEHIEGRVDGVHIVLVAKFLKKA